MHACNADPQNERFREYARLVRNEGRDASGRNGRRCQRRAKIMATDDPRDQFPSLVTSFDAKRRFCCLAVPEAEQNLCEGPRCMAWRWFPAKKAKTDPRKEIEVGYCGLAGAPY